MPTFLCCAECLCELNIKEKFVSAASCAVCSVPVCPLLCRMHMCIEDLLADNELISLLQDLLLLSDRAKLADLPALAASS